MKELVEKLNYYTKLYDEGHPAISDEEYDRLYFNLIQLEKEAGYALENSPTQKINYEVVNNLPKVKHNHKMLSLDKTKNIEEINAFVKNNDFVAMAKMDGLTCSLRYVNGKLVSAETRGNGIIGEDVLHNAQVIPSIPKVVDFKDELIVDGEIICLAADFEQFADKYKNPRNFASGSIRLLDANECAKRKLTFILWDVIKGYNGNSFVEGLSFASKLGFMVVPWIQENSTYAIGDLQDWCGNQGYPIDGIVFKFNDIAYGKAQGETGHHFKNAIAYKFYDEEFETRLLNIEWSMGRTGILTPVAIFEPIDDGDSIIERANLHNLNIMRETLGECPYKGQKIWVCKQNAIIPQVVKAEKELPTSYRQDKIIIFFPPTKCPICGQFTAVNESEQLYCTNPDCDGKLLNKLEHFFGKKGLDVKGISKATFEKLVDWGWVEEIADVFNLFQHRDEWMDKTGFGAKSVDNILSNIDKAVHNTPLDNFICAIGIPQIGPNTARILADTFHYWTNFREAVIDKYQFSNLYDFGYIMEDEILNFDYTQADKIAKILNITYESPKVNNEKLNGLKIAITGGLHYYKNRNELEAAIAAAGGKSVSSVTKNTNILINNDSNSSSSKNITAKKLGIPILTEAEFKEKYLD